jgi:hypothetical protein
VLELVPSADREGMSVERMREAYEGESREAIERMLTALRENIDNPIISRSMRCLATLSK